MFVFSDTFHGPIDLADYMIPVCDNVSVWKAGFGYRSKVRIHVANKVFYVGFRWKL